MFLSKLRMATVTVFVLAFLAAGVGAVARVGGDDSKTQGDEGQREVSHQTSAGDAMPNFSLFKESREVWSLSLQDAIRIGLGNSNVIRMIPTTATGIPDRGYTIAPRAANVDIERFKAEIMAQVRSIEQQYWSLAQQHDQLRANQKAIEQAEEILKREQSDLEVGRGTVADVAEIAQRLEQFRLDRVTKTSDVITTERQLRNLLGLPPTDDRRIVPSTVPTEALLEPDWKTCRAVMLEKQPDVVRAKAEMARADKAPEGFAEVEGRKAVLEQVIHQTSHSLARFFLEIEANYKQFKTASRYRAAAFQRLEAQRAFYEEGRITVDRYLDAVSQYASAVAQEAQFKTSYNISIIALEEAKGTLLEYDNITVADGPKSATSAVVARKDDVKPAPVQPPTTAPNAPLARLDPTVSQASGAKKDEGRGTDLDGKTVSFQLTIGRGSHPLEIRGSFTITPIQSAELPKTR
jgi:hypothetical protein